MAVLAGFQHVILATFVIAGSFLTQSRTTSDATTQGSSDEDVIESYCCDENGNLVLQTFDSTLSTDEARLSLSYERKSEILRNLVDALGGAIFSKDLPQDKFAEMYIQKRDDNASAADLENIRKVMRDYGWDNTGFVVAIALCIVYMAVVVLMANLFLVLRLFKKAFVKPVDGSHAVQFYTLAIITGCLSLTMLPTMVFWKQNWDESVKKSYPDQFLSRVDTINSHLMLFLSACSNDLDSLTGEQLNFTFDHIQTNLQDLPSLTFQPVEKKILDDITGPIEHFQAALTEAEQQWNATVVAYDNMVLSAKVTSDEVTSAKTSIGAMSCTTGDPECSQAQLLWAEISKHEKFFSAVMSNPLDSETVLLFNSDIVTAVNQEMDAMVDAITDTVSSAVDEMMNMSIEAEEVTKSLIDLIGDDLSDTFSPFDLNDYLWQPTDDLDSDAKDYIEKLTPYNTAARYLVLTLSILGIVSMLGPLVLWRRKISVSERSSASHLMGFAILAYSIAAAICSVLYMVYALYLFRDASPFLQTCSSFQKGHIQFLDKPGVLSNDSDNYVAELVLENESIALTLNSILQNCYNNSPLYETLKWSSSSKYDIEGTLNVNFLLPGAEGVFASATPDVSSTVLLPDSLKTDLTNFDDTEHDTTYDTMLDTATDILEWYAQLRDGSPGVTVTCGASCTSMPDIYTQLQTFIGNGIDPSDARLHAQDAAAAIDNVVSTLSPEMETLAVDLQNNVSQLRDSLLKLKESIDNVLLPAENTLQNWIANDATPMLEASVEQVGSNVEKYLGNYLTWLLEILQNDLGKCDRVSNAYDYFWSYTCEQVVQPWNVLWLLGFWVSLCLLFQSICSFRLCFFLFRSTSNEPAESIEEKPIKTEAKSENATLVDKFFSNSHDGKGRPTSGRSVSIETEVGTGSTRDTWINNNGPNSTTSSFHNHKHFIHACVGTGESNSHLEDVLEPTLTSGQRSVTSNMTPTPSEVTNEKPPLSSRSRGAVSNIVRLKNSLASGGKADRPSSAPGNFTWNKVVYVGSKGSTNIFATTSSSRENSILDDVSFAHDSNVSTPKQAWDNNAFNEGEKATETEVNTEVRTEKKEGTKDAELLNYSEEPLPIEDETIVATEENKLGLKLSMKNESEAFRVSTLMNSARNSRSTSLANQDEDSSTEADRVYFTRTAHGMKSATPVVLATHSSLNSSPRKPDDNDTPADRINAIKNEKLRQTRGNDGETAIGKNKGSLGSKQAQRSPGDGDKIQPGNVNIRSVPSEEAETEQKSNERSGNTDGKSYPPEKTETGAQAQQESEVLSDRVFDLNQRSRGGTGTSVEYPDTSHRFNALPPLDVSSFGVARRESTLPLVEESNSVPREKTQKSVIVYRHADKLKKKKKGKNKVGLDTADSPASNKGGYRGVDDPLPGFIDASLLKQKSTKL